MSSVVKAHVSHLYFERGLAKSEIAGRLGISRFKVARLLDQARDEGIVRIEIHEPLPLDDTLARELERSFGLELALVVRAGAEPEPVDAVARVAADWLPQLVRPDDVVGVAWGSTVQRVVRGLPATPDEPVPVVQICGALAGIGRGEGPMELAWQLAERLGGRFYPLPVPALVDRASARAEMLRNSAVAPTVAMFDRVSLALVGIGSFADEGRSALLTSGYLTSDDLPRLRRAGAAGDVLVHFFAEDGRIVETALSKRAIQLDLEQLRRARVLAVASGPGKERAIRGALRAGLIDILVTDQASAEAAL